MTLLRRLHDMDRSDRATIKLGAICVVAIILAAVGWLAWSAKSTATSASTGIQGSCEWWHDVAILPLTQTTSKTVLTLVADARIAYTKQDCAADTGQLPAPDPRVALLLPPQYR